MRRGFPNIACGNLIAKTLSASWRRVPEPPSLLPENLLQIAPSLLASGAGGLAWRQIKTNRFASTSRFDRFKDAYRKHSIEAAIHEVNIADIFRRLRAAGIEPILFKGWGLARLYPEAGLRPYGDLDLWVQAEDLEEFYRVLVSRGDYVYCVEPHVSFYPEYERPFAEIMKKSKLVSLNGLQVRVPGDEDHLRFICLHFLRHGGWRPLWLCDIALMVESAGTNFDWDVCLRGQRKHTDWIACTIGLAHQLLGADVCGTPVAKRAKALPSWLATAMVRQWETGAGMSSAETLSFSLTRRWRQPQRVVAALSEHWRNPIQASVEMDAWFSEAPRSVLQIGAALSRAPQLAAQIGPEMRRARRPLS